MITRVIRSEIPSFKVKIKPSLWLHFGYSLDTRYDKTFPSISTKQI